MKKKKLSLTEVMNAPIAQGYIIPGALRDINIETETPIINSETISWGKLDIIGMPTLYPSSSIFSKKQNFKK